MQKKDLQAREAKIAGVSRLKMLQDRVDDLRADGHLRSLLVGSGSELEFSLGWVGVAWTDAAMACQFYRLKFIRFAGATGSSAREQAILHVNNVGP